MADVYAVEIKASFYVQADSPDEAERIAKKACWWTAVEDMMPVGCTPDMAVRRTPNQSDDMKSRAVNA